MNGFLLLAAVLITLPASSIQAQGLGNYKESLDQAAVCQEPEELDSHPMINGSDGSYVILWCKGRSIGYARAVRPPSDPSYPLEFMTNGSQTWGVNAANQGAGMPRQAKAMFEMQYKTVEAKRNRLREIFRQIIDEGKPAFQFINHTVPAGPREPVVYKT